MSSKKKKTGSTDRAPRPEDWDAWTEYLAHRRRPLPVAQLIPSGKRSALRWALPSSVSGSESARLATQLENISQADEGQQTELAEQLEAWLGAVDGRRADAEFGLECLAWSHALPDLAAILPAAPWTQALERLLEIAGEAASGLPADNVWAEQLLSIELSVTLAYLFPELPGGQALVKPAMKRLSNSIRELLDGDGLPRACHLPLVRPLLACWTRTCYLARAAGGTELGKKERLIFEWFVRRALMFTRQDGTAVLSNVEDSSVVDDCEALFDAALTLAGDPDDVAIADQILPGRKALRKKAGKLPLLPDSAANSEWSEIAVLRPNWLHGGEHLTLTFHDRRIQAELNCGATTVWSGDWTPVVSIDGRRLEPTEDWEQNCWASDDDVDFIELELPMQDGWRLQRQIAFAREDRFLYVGDAVLGSQTAEIAFHSSLPLCPGVEYRPAEESHEGFLVGKKRIGLVMPLALPEWRSAESDGSLGLVDDGLQLTITRSASRLYAPLFIDLDRQRTKKEATWRSLTVADRLEIQPASSAVGYRVQVGMEQWLIYRSLATPGNRTLLGQNLTNEFYLGRFDEDGEADEMIAIDTAEEE